MRPRLICKRKLFLTRPAIMISPAAAARFVRVGSQKDYLQLGEKCDHSPNDVVGQCRITRRNVTREKRCLRLEQARIVSKAEAWFGSELLQPLQKENITLVSATRSSCPLNPPQVVQVV